MTSNSTTPDSPQQCPHERLTEEGYCRRCNADCRGIPDPFHTSLPTPKCPQCDQPLKRVVQETNSLLNHDQWASTIAGEWFCTCHNNHRGNKPYAYFWQSEFNSGAAHPSETRAGEQEGSTMEPEIKPHSSVLYTDLTVRCHGCKSALVWRYLEDIDEIEVLHEHEPAPVQTGEGSTMRSGKMLDRMEQDLAAQSEGVAPNRQTWQSMSSDEQLSFLAAQAAEIERLIESQADAFETQRQIIDGLQSELKAAQSLNEFFRDSVGECHVMISRNTAEFQIRKEWESTDLPPRLQKLIASLSAAETLVGELRTQLESARNSFGMICENDKTRYRHNQSRPDGKLPSQAEEPGSIWLTPKEMASTAKAAIDLVFLKHPARTLKKEDGKDE